MSVCYGHDTTRHLDNVCILHRKAFGMGYAYKGLLGSCTTGFRAYRMETLAHHDLHTLHVFTNQNYNHAATFKLPPIYSNKW
jgi:hypothetical protein